ncbi:unnamed protein product, partial [Amoebophrya sp. A25]
SSASPTLSPHHRGQQLASGSSPVVTSTRPAGRRRILSTSSTTVTELLPKNYGVGVTTDFQHGMQHLALREGHLIAGSLLGGLPQPLPGNKRLSGSTTNVPPVREGPNEAFPSRTALEEYEIRELADDLNTVSPVDKLYDDQVRNSETFLRDRQYRAFKLGEEDLTKRSVSVTSRKWVPRDPKTGKQIPDPKDGGIQDTK